MMSESKFNAKIDKSPALGEAENGRRRLKLVPRAVKGSAENPHIDEREERLFRSLDTDNDQHVLYGDLEQRLTDAGLEKNDERLQESFADLKGVSGTASLSANATPAKPIPRPAFCAAIRKNILLIEKALQGNLVIADFPKFRDEIRRIYDTTVANREGEPARYIPQLDLAEPDVDQFGVSLCTVDGQRFAMGDSAAYFSVQSTCKPVNYCLALEAHGHEFVHRFIGHEPSGASFNELALDKLNRPHNPMINAGAIMSSALIGLGRRGRQSENSHRMTASNGAAGSRFEMVMETWRMLCGGEKPRFSTPVYLSERETADRNFALGYFMREKDAFPEGVDLHDALDFYFQCCSLEVTTEMMSVVAATLANGGICPATGERIFRTETVQNCLSLMSSCGMYDFSGEFAFTIGLPAKSGVSGAIMIVVPNVMGLCVWSPRLDVHGNSVRGIDFCRELVGTFNFHNYDILTTTECGKRDPRVSQTQLKASRINDLVWAASKGDLGAIHNLLLRGARLDAADYDKRTSLHLAAAENQVEVVRSIIDARKRGDVDIDLNARDRWGGTPLDDACLHGHTAIIELLENEGGKHGAAAAPAENNLAILVTGQQAESRKMAELIWAASTGDMAAIYRLVAQGASLDAADYDFRTALHLAAAEGRLDVVEYLVVQRANLNPLDRWGNTPLDDAGRHGHKAVVSLLEKAGGMKGTCIRGQAKPDRKGGDESLQPWIA